MAESKHLNKLAATPSHEVAKTSKKSTNSKTKTRRMEPPTKGETLVKGVVMGLIISNANQVTKSIAALLIKHPAALFSTGFVSGYLACKYRKEILILGSQTAEESKSFVLRQKEKLFDLVAEYEEKPKKTD